MNCDRKDLLLYAVTDRYWLEEKTLPEVVEDSLKGGATFVQLREKNLGEKEFLEEAKELQKLCRKYRVPFVVNDNISIAKEMGADGVHIGQEDGDPKEVRKILGEEKIIGVSVQTVEQAETAVADGADYLGVGAMFPTGSKEDASEVDFPTLKKICETVSVPVVAIGGITKENVFQLKDTGIAGIAVISAIYGQKNIYNSAKELKAITEELFL
ncbi:thiamine phosphate synthase [Peptoniphilus sp. KCTC 25270]|uniref:thiamine phosphate synthase n=1 Tax=Peptoniphilus sp. KCTC 25270 TaxID=2897414 RepID=UPI001E2A41CF|nr:thiamine phosphate synthase [Peptoniphilus sp. KCTC 25270]MCD1147242.1 thiamine phosphate synthase [Peptoniphilus sp. KCTC 25270]